MKLRVHKHKRQQHMFFVLANRYWQRRIDEALEAIARQTEGAVVRLGLASTDLGVLYRERIAPMARRRTLDSGFSNLGLRYALSMRFGRFTQQALYRWTTTRWRTWTDWPK